jgi:hypothetical protein
VSTPACAALLDGHMEQRFLDVTSHDATAQQKIHEMGLRSLQTQSDDSRQAGIAEAVRDAERQEAMSGPAAQTSSSGLDSAASRGSSGSSC